jgi:surface polysaccharide O-acyltransferase-like enzyme
MQPYHSRIDFLRFISITAVIIIHCSTSITAFTIKPDTNWWIGNFYDTLSRFCVPVFVMISGSLILPKDYTLGEFIKKRFLRIIPPFSFWTAVFIIFNCFDKHLFGGNYIFKFIALSILNGAFFHLWFIYMLIGVYLISPIISKWLKQATEKEIQYFLILWLIGLLFNLPLLHKIGLKSVLVNFETYLGYFVLGYYLSIKDFKLKNIKLIACLLFLTGFLITFFGTYLCSVQKKSFCEDIADFKNINICLMATAVFIYFKNADLKFPATINFLIAFISKYSFGIYFLHPLVIIFLEKINIHYSLTNPLWGVPATTLVVLVISALILRIMRLLPWGNYLTGVN